MIRSADIMGGMLSSTTIQNYKKAKKSITVTYKNYLYGHVGGSSGSHHTPHTTVTEKAFCRAFSTDTVEVKEYGRSEVKSHARQSQHRIHVQISARHQLLISCL